MANSLLNQPQGNSLFSRLNQIRGMLSGDPDAMYRQMMQNNPQFAKFVMDNQGKTPDQIAQENGIDMDQVRQFFGNR